jgi:peptide/nickel transport system ATP-binding protein
LGDDELRQIRGSDIAMIYQEPFASLNPSLKISTQLMEVPLAHENISKEGSTAAIGATC